MERERGNAMMKKGCDQNNDLRSAVLAVRRGRKLGQVVIEFTFCLIIVLLMIYGVTKVFFWAGRDLVERRKAHDALLTSDVTPPQQIAPDFYTPVKMNAIWVPK